MPSPVSPGTPSIWIDDDHAILRRGLEVSLVSEGFTIAGQSSQLLPTPTPDAGVLLFQCTSSSLRTAIRLHELRGVLLVGMVQQVREDEACRMLEAGMRAILVTSALTVESLVATLHAVLSGAVMAPAPIMARTLAHARREGLGPAALTDRERAVLRLLAEGSDTLEMAHELSFSERTVKNIVHDVLMKLNCRTRAHAVALATRSGAI